MQNDDLTKNELTHEVRHSPLLGNRTNNKANKILNVTVCIITTKLKG
jgi:hypothetical protein